MTPDIERAARALMISEGDDPDRETTIADRPVGWMLMTDTVITVIEALVEPSNAAVEAGADALCACWLRRKYPGTTITNDQIWFHVDTTPTWKEEARAALRAANLAVLGRIE